MSVVQFKTKEEEQREEVIRLLEKRLEDARNGEVVGVGIALVYANGSIDSSFRTNSCPMLLGALARLMAHVNTDMDEHTISV